VTTSRGSTSTVSVARGYRAVGGAAPWPPPRESLGTSCMRPAPRDRRPVRSWIAAEAAIRGPAAAPPRTICRRAFPPGTHDRSARRKQARAGRRVGLFLLVRSERPTPQLGDARFWGESRSALVPARHTRHSDRAHRSRCLRVSAPTRDSPTSAPRKGRGGAGCDRVRAAAAHDAARRRRGPPRPTPSARRWPHGRASRPRRASGLTRGGWLTPKAASPSEERARTRSRAMPRQEPVPRPTGARLHRAERQRLASRGDAASGQAAGPQAAQAAGGEEAAADAVSASQAAGNDTAARLTAPSPIAPAARATWMITRSMN
jgi:hypothetical protein